MSYWQIKISYSCFTSLFNDFKDFNIGVGCIKIFILMGHNPYLIELSDLIKKIPSSF